MKINYKEKKLLNPMETPEKEIKFAIKETDLQLQSDILATEQAISNSDKRLSDLKTNYPFSIQEYLKELEENQSLKNGLAEMKKLQIEFGFVTETKKPNPKSNK